MNDFSCLLKLGSINLETKTWLSNKDKTLHALCQEFSQFYGLNDL
jgi:hypothetical protein